MLTYITRFGMMRPLFTSIFLFLLSGTIMSQSPRTRCDVLHSKDFGFSNPQNGDYSFKNEVYLNDQTVYIYDSKSKRAVPQPGWQNVENWNEVSQLQKEREELIMKDLEEIINLNTDNTGIYTTSQNVACQLCSNDAFRMSGYTFVEGTEFSKNSKRVFTLATQDLAAEMMKHQSKQDPMFHGYQEKKCIEILQKYRNYRDAH
ncbi:zinc-alpha-2-glycoprotein-like [Monodelphis domestica]|uniref:zinc-alpha-2-glycoprotein-like n=1 Tax=Monodelphis domestica TaxID=13616 RepID=UPI0024E22829|nr:zinc-alpha-2-glycoprotein-like [Monodelphis domestica]